MVWGGRGEKNGKVVMGGGGLLGRVEPLKNNEEEEKRGSVFRRQLFVLEVWDMKRRTGM